MPKPAYLVTNRRRGSDRSRPQKRQKIIIVKINTQLMQTLQSPDVRERFAAEGIEALGGTPDQFAEYIRSEIARWGRVIKEAGVRPE